MDGIESILRQIKGGLVLDVATHEGHFISMLAEHLPSYQYIVGIDVDKKSILVAAGNLANDKICFSVMDAEQLAFEGGIFDTVNISASLHHLANVHGVLAEMVRVLKPGGEFILFEMYADAPSEPAQTSISLHHWVAEVDTALGLPHHKTLSRQEFVDFTARLGLSKVEYADVIDINSDPKEMARTAQLENLIMRTMQRAEETPHPVKLKARGNELLQQLYTIGAQREPIIAVVGTK